MTDDERRRKAQIARDEYRAAVFVFHPAVGAVGLERIEQELRAGIHLSRVVALLGQIARRHEGQQHVAGDGHGVIPAPPHCGPRAIRLLLGREVVQRAIDYRLRRRIDDHRISRCRFLTVRGKSAEQKCRVHADGSQAERAGDWHSR